MVELDIRGEPSMRAADDRNHERKPVARSADDRLGAAADANPGAERSRLGRRIGALARERRPRRPPPSGPGLPPQFCEELELLLEQHLVVVEAISKQWK